jgi:uncharacterized membrane protein
MASVAFCFWAETQQWGQKTGGPLLLLLISMALSNLGVIPHHSDLYSSIHQYLVPVAIPLLLFRTDLKQVFRESGPLLLAFCLAAGSTLIAALAGAWLVELGPMEPEIAGTLVASYIGGTVNFVATAEAVGVKDSSLYLASFSADAVGAVLFLIVLMSLPVLAFVRRAMPSRLMDEKGRSLGDSLLHHGEEKGLLFDLGKAANGVSISLVICAVSAWLTGAIGIENYFILVATVLALTVANLGKPLLSHVRSDFEIGTLFMYVFFAAIGAGADIGAVLDEALPILLFITVLIGVHLVFLIFFGWILRLDLAEVMVASNACILGPATAAAFAASKGWRQLITPGMLVGLLGYALATFIGVAMASLLRAMSP